MSPKDETQKSDGFTDEQRAAMKELSGATDEARGVSLLRESGESRRAATDPLEGLQIAYACPQCHAALVRHWHDRGSSWVCEGCGGEAITMAVIRQHAAPAWANAIWNAAHESRDESVRSCPGCSRAMKRFAVEDESGSTELEGCIGCQFFWFDAGQLARLGIVMKELPYAEARQAMAELEMGVVRENGKLEAFGQTMRGLYRHLLQFLLFWWW